MNKAYTFKNIRVYFLAFVAYWGIVLFGYDTGVAGGVVSQTAFKTHFLTDSNGNIDSNKVTNTSGNVVSVLQAGAFFGALGSAPISARFGRKPTLLGFSLIFVVGAILQTIAGVNGRGLGYIYGGRVVAGVGVGAISAVAPAYVSECSPKDVRGRITGLFQIMVAIGVMISYFINFGISQHNPNGPRVWQIPFGFQIVPAGIMCIGLLFVKESPRWLASRGRTHEALRNLAYLRKDSIDSDDVRYEMAEIEAAIEEEREARKGLGLKEAFFGKGNFIRFVIAFVIFFLQQWAGQNSVNYYAPQIFTAIGYKGATNSLLASGIYGVIKVVATAIFVFFFVETLGRKFSLAISAFGMGTLFYIIGAILKTHPPPASLVDGAAPPPASKAMAAMLYIYVAFYSMGWGPLPWVYVSDIFPTRTRHYGLALASASQWLWNFVVSRVTPNIIANLGYKVFIMFATVNIGAMFIFSLVIPETKGKSLEEMDIIFGSVSQEQRDAKIKETERAIEHDLHETRSDSSAYVENNSNSLLRHLRPSHLSGSEALRTLHLDMSVHTKTQLILPETERVARKIASIQLTGAPAPLKLGTSLDSIKKSNSTPLIGTEFARGVQLSELLKAPNADEIIKDLAITISQRGVIFFRDQNLTIDEQKKLGAKLGELTGKPASSKLHIHPITEETSELGDEISIISSDRSNYSKSRSDRTTLSAANWHADITFEPVPSDYAILKIHTLPVIDGEETGGDTLWASGYEVYDRLSPSFAKYLETLEAVHEARFFRFVAGALGNKLRDGERGSPGNVGDHLEAVHPVIRTNPVTGWKSVFVNPNFTKRIVGVTKDESDVILQHLFNLIQLNHDLQVRFRWEKNSIAIWDNRSNYHTATFDYGKEKRVGDRVVSLGERPYCEPNSKSRREALGLKQ
ncbi:hypothetical protein EW145_g7000 [Phellinidium pouzarii]|uniref:Major facilitator superfamily (MFS) profile domain-containing protein n=1 Tax=Phellinidium pouzarii TaxID=167371 RepID=A0A4S4KQU8_9AGAM|nr:hypothetical protein EW145_g7000 [Phellinidium pouzarii]